MKIRCAVCDKDVDEAIWFDDMQLCVKTIVARCHGHEDRMQVTHQDLVDWGRELESALAAGSGVAFVEALKLSRQGEGIDGNR